MELSVSAPGKIIVMGEHAAVYGKPALVAAVDRRVEVRYRSSPDLAGLRLLLPQLDVDETWTWKGLRSYAAERRAAWQTWHEDGHRRPFAELLDARASQLIATAVGEALEDADHSPRAGATLEVRSGLPIGAGFGSSAAASAATIQALLLAFGEKAPKERVERLCLEAERRQHGTPSGVDGAAVVRGGLLWTEKDSAGHLLVERVPVLRESFYDRLLIAHSGSAAESTGEVVAAVRRLRGQDQQAFDQALERAAVTTQGLREDLEGRAAEASIVERFRSFSAWLVAIGVVPAPLCRAIDRIEAVSGAAKISGAGSLRGPGAGSFLVYHPRPAVAAEVLGSLEGIEPMNVRLGAEGVGPS